MAVISSGLSSLGAVVSEWVSSFILAFGFKVFTLVSILRPLLIWFGLFQRTGSSTFIHYKGIRNAEFQTKVCLGRRLCGPKDQPRVRPHRRQVRGALGCFLPDRGCKIQPRVST